MGEHRGCYGKHHKISVIVAFYKGNQYMERLFKGIKTVAEKVKDRAELEVVLVNDSPDVEAELPNPGDAVVIKNEKNLGIQKTRANGIRRSTGDWILILDQDDELVADGFGRQLELMDESDIVVGNGLYQYGNSMVRIYKSLKEMNYLLQKKRFLEIRNLIPSPGECLIRKTAIPEFWMNHPLQHNGADDWLLWILLFQEGCRFACNEENVYIHHDAGGQNLSWDLEKIHASTVEMCGILKDRLNDAEHRTLRRAVEFKYLQDSGKLRAADFWRYKKSIIDNIFYKLQADVC